MTTMNSYIDIVIIITIYCVKLLFQLYSGNKPKSRNIVHTEEKQKEFIGIVCSMKTHTKLFTVLYPRQDTHEEHLLKALKLCRVNSIQPCYQPKNNIDYFIKNYYKFVV